MIEGSDGGDRRIITIFDDFYNNLDSTAYYQAMDRAGFNAPDHAAAGFLAALAELKRLRELSSASIMDFACGYGIAGALMRKDMQLCDVLQRYRDPWFADVTAEEIVRADADWYHGFENRSDDTYAGIDIAPNAVAFAKTAGIFDHSFAENLQANEVSGELAKVMQGCDMIVECGSVAHMLPIALDRLLTAAPARKPWVVTSPIRGNDTAKAIAVMERHGLVVEKLDVAPYRYRKFSSAEEQARAIVNAQERGHDTDGAESEGFFHCQLFIARPADEITSVGSWVVSPELGAST